MWKLHLIAWIFCSFHGREIVCNNGVSTALFLHALASHPEHVLLLPDTVTAQRLCPLLELWCPRRK